MDRRNFLKKSSVPIMLAGTSTSTVAFANTSEKNNASKIIIVGASANADYSDLTTAVEQISDSSIDNPYLVKVEPGIFQLAKLTKIPEFVHIEGSGANITSIRCEEWATLKVSTGSSLSHLTISGNNVKTKGIISPNAQRVINFKLSHVDIYLKGGKSSAIALDNYNHVTHMDNVLIITDSIGMILQGFHYINSTNIFLSGVDTYTDYIGIFVPGMCRLYLWNSKIGTGYGETNESGFAPNLEVIDPNSAVVGIFIPESNDQLPRLELHGVESFCRNEDMLYQPTSMGINCIRAENGWVRMFGCFTQSEVPLNPSLQVSIHQQGKGRVEVYGTRYSSLDGNLTSRGQKAVSNYSSPEDDWRVLQNWDGGTIFCDATAGDLNIEMQPFWKSTPPGLEYKFVKIDESANSVIIHSNDLKLTNGATQISLAEQYESVTLVTAGRLDGLFKLS